MMKSLVHSIKHPPEPVKRLVKQAITRYGPVARWAARRARVVSRGPVLQSGLVGFFVGGRRLDLIASPTPEVSVIVVVERRADRVLATLRALATDRGPAIEVILVDNAAQGMVRSLLGRIEHATIIRTERRLPRAAAADLAVEAARGEFVAWLDADAMLAPGSLAAALATIRSRADVGAVVGSTIGQSERLEEAGNILWQDGSVESYGAGCDPSAPEYQFTRAVDFGAGAFLLARRTAVEREPAFWLLDRIKRSVDLRASGLETVYDPRVVAHRLGSSPAWSVDPAVVAGAVGAALEGQLARSEGNLLRARHRATGRHRVLHIEQRVPHITLGAGYPRSNRIVAELVQLGYFVTFYPMDRLFRSEKWADVYSSVDRSVEVMTDHSAATIGAFLAARAGYYDAILISRPPNMEAVQPFLSTIRVDGRPRIIYDAEALFTSRTIEQRRLEGKAPSPDEERAMIATEVALVAGSDAVLAVSEGDARNFAEHGIKDVRILSHCIDPTPTPRPFVDRSGFLFVGPVLFYGSPNADSIEWFATQIFPEIRRRLGDQTTFQVAGRNHATQLFPLEGNGVQFLGRVPDLTSVYDSARVFVAPTRFAAGIPLKCVEAAAHGVPIVMTALLANQLGWEPEVEVLVAETEAAFAEQCVRLYQDPDLWASIRTNALRRFETTYSPRVFAATLRATVGPPTE